MATDGGNSSGVSRALVKDRLIFHPRERTPFSTNKNFVVHRSATFCDCDWDLDYAIRFKVFNIQFEELHQKQSQWTVPDTELRESLRLAVAEVLLPAYRSFVKRFGCVIFSIHQMFCLFCHYSLRTRNIFICIHHACHF